MHSKAPDHTLVLLGRAVQPLRRTAVPGDSPLEAAYTIVNRVLAAFVLLLLAPLMARRGLADPQGRRFAA